MVLFIHSFAIFAEETNQLYTMNEIIEIFTKNNGYARMKNLKQAGIHTRRIAAACEEGIIEKIKPGLYKLVDYPWDQYGSFVDVCNANSKAVICLLSAASYYEFTTFDPPAVYTAIPRNSFKFAMIHPPVKLYYFPEKQYNCGIENILTDSGIFRIYNREKVVVDLFRYKDKLGEDVAIESLKNYLRDRKRVNIPRLIEYAGKGKTRRELESIMKGMLS